MGSLSKLNHLQQEMGIVFSDLSLLQRALTHRSFLNEHPEHSLEDNERLEFLGDAVLDFLAGDYLYHRFPEMDEGQLTRLRAALVRTESLAAFARHFGLGEALLLGRGEDDSGGRQRPKNLCGAFEAVIGALYLDQGLAAVRDFIAPLFEPALTEILESPSDKDPKSLLQEWGQATYGETPVYHTVASNGPDHEKQFTVEVLIGTRVLGVGTGHSKQTAAQAAAQHALDAIRSGKLTLE